MAYPSTFVTLQDKVIRRLRLDATADRATVKDVLNVIYAQCAVEHEAFQAAANMTVTPNASTYTLPAGIVRIKEMTSTATGQTSPGPPLKQASLDEILALRQSTIVASTNDGTATKYALVGKDQLELWPTPTAADTLLIYYTYQPTALVNDADPIAIQEPYATQVLFYGALAELADDMSDPSEVNYRQLFDMWMQKWRLHLNRRHGGVSTQMRVVGQPAMSIARDRDVW